MILQTVDLVTSEVKRRFNCQIQVTAINVVRCTVRRTVGRWCYSFIRARTNHARMSIASGRCSIWQGKHTNEHRQIHTHKSRLLEHLLFSLNQGKTPLPWGFCRGLTADVTGHFAVGSSYQHQTDVHIRGGFFLSCSDRMLFRLPASVVLNLGAFEKWPLSDPRLVKHGKDKREAARGFEK